MCKVFVAVVSLLILFMSNVQASIDPDPNSIGVYFEESADTNSKSVGVDEVFDAFVIVTNPSEESIHGFAFTYRLVVTSGNADGIFRIANLFGWVGFDGIGGMLDAADRLEGFYAAGSSVPHLGDSAVVLIHWQFLLTSPVAFDIFLGPLSSAPYEFSSPVYAAGGYTVSLGLSSGDSSVPVARVNGESPVAVTGSDFGSVKALYR